MTFAAVIHRLHRIENEYLDLNRQKLNQELNIPHIGLTLENTYDQQKAVSVNSFMVHTKRKINQDNNIRLLSKYFCPYISEQIIQYLGLYQSINVKFEIIYDPFYYPFHEPQWRVVDIKLEMISDEFKKGILHLVQAHRDILHYDWSPAISMRQDITYFMSKFCRLLEYV
jgi:hypothetical protein